jgi:AcrR family transcriptional regulator
MPRAVQARAREEPMVRRDQILNETIRLLGKRGYYGLTIQEVAKSCGLSNAGLLYYFASKDHLLVAVLQEFDRHETEIIAPLAELATRRIGRGANAETAAVELLRAIVLRGIAQPELVRLYNVLQSESLEPSHPAHQAFREREARILDLLTETMRSHVPDPRSAARRLFALMDGLGQQWIRSGQAFDIVDEWDRAVAAFLPHLAAPQVKQRAPARRKKA